ncbi:MAG: SRPBCC domain-containing protein [Pseudomonadota bacterium]
MAPLTLTTPTDTSVQMVRRFDAALPLVWRAFTEAELVQQWLTGPAGHTMPECEIDFRVGGAWRYLWQMPQGQMEGKGFFKNITDHDRYVHSESFDIAPEMESLVETAFVETDGTTTVTIVVHYQSQANRDMSVAHGMDKGMEASFANLDQLLPGHL